MECGVAMLAGNWWAGLLTWVAFAVVVTAAVTFVAARRHPGVGSLPLFPSMKSGACRTGSRNSPGVSIRLSAPPYAPRGSPVFVDPYRTMFRFGLISSRNSIRVDSRVRNTPSIAEVTALAFCFSTPRIIMHR